MIRNQKIAAMKAMISKKGNSMKPTVLITKIGSVCYTKEYTRTKRNLKNAARGEQGTTEAVVNHLLKRGDIRVVYFGKWY